MITKHGTFTMTRDDNNKCCIVVTDYHFNTSDPNTDITEEVLIRARDDINMVLRKHRRGKLQIIQDDN